MPFNPQLALAALEAHPDTLGANDAERLAYIAELRQRLGVRTPEDRREATKIAVDTSKMFLTIGIAVLVAIGPWLQYLHANGAAWESPAMFFFYLAAAALVFSMGAGFLAISHVYKRADGREAPDQPAWATEPIAGFLNGQSWSGALALIFLGIGLLVWGTGATMQPSAVTVTIPGNGSVLSSGSLAIRGDWNELRLQTAAHQELRLPKQTVPVAVTCR
jgi:hypothetical protein